MLNRNKLKPISQKWAQCIIKGKGITVDQAREIISRTDLFFVKPYSRGNDDRFVSELKDRLGIPVGEKFDKWKKDNKILDLSYMSNDWISSWYIGGPNGWCHIDGTIYRVMNIGKYPNWDSMIADLEILGKEFPFLDMNVWIMDDEEGYVENCLGGINLKNGELSNIKFNDFKMKKLNLRKEVGKVVKLSDNTLYERCPEEHLFRMDEALEYFAHK